jgi:hypothetical protein
MSLDRFVQWNKKKPDRDEILSALRGYMGELGTIEIDDKGWVFVVIPGKPSEPLSTMWKRDDERWFEIFFDDNKIDIITRTQDTLTNCIAEGFAKFCERYWEGTLDQEWIVR